MHLSAEYAFCVMSLQCSAFGNIALHIVFAIYAMHFMQYAICNMQYAIYAMHIMHVYIYACMQIAFAICIALYV